MKTRSEPTSFVVVVDNVTKKRRSRLVQQAFNLFRRHIPDVAREHQKALFADGSHRLVLIVTNRIVRSAALFRRCKGSRQQPAFTELALLATHNVYQKKGLANLAINVVKQIAAQTTNVLVTYADLAAVGFFRKLGFTDKLILNKKIYDKHLYPYLNAVLMDVNVKKTHRNQQQALYRTNPHYFLRSTCPVRAFGTICETNKSKFNGPMESGCTIFRLVDR